MTDIPSGPSLQPSEFYVAIDLVEAAATNPKLRFWVSTGKLLVDMQARDPGSSYVQANEPIVHEAVDAIWRDLKRPPRLPVR